MNILTLVQQQHGTQITNPFVCETRAGRQLEALELAKVRRVAEHVYVQQLGNVATTAYGNNKWHAREGEREREAG